MKLSDLTATLYFGLNISMKPTYFCITIIALNYNIGIKTGLQVAEGLYVYSCTSDPEIAYSLQLLILTHMLNRMLGLNPNCDIFLSLIRSILKTHFVICATRSPPVRKSHQRSTTFLFNGDSLGPVRDWSCETLFF